MRKGIISSRLIYSIIGSIILTNLYIKTPNGKLILFPFMICSFALTIKYIFMLFDKDKYARIFNKIYSVGFLLFLLGFLMFWCYKGIVDKQYSMLIFSIPFWIAGVYIIKKKFRNKNNVNENSNKQSNKLKLNFPIVMTCILVGVSLLVGILMLFFGIKDTYKLNKTTEDYIITTGYFETYDVFNADEDSVTYKLTYIYMVDGNEYSITTDYGTNYIPKEHSVRDVKYDPNNPEKSILVGANSKNGLIYAGAFFTFGALTFVIIGLSILGLFDKVKIDVVRTYIGCLFLGIGVGVVLLQNATTMSLLETIKNMKLWVLIPILFAGVGIHQLIYGIFISKKKK